MRVLVEVDEARRDDQAAGVDLDAAVKGFGADRPDLSAGEADIADAVEAALGVEDAAAAEDDVERALVGRRDASRKD